MRTNWNDGTVAFIVAGVLILGAIVIFFGYTS